MTGEQSGIFIAKCTADRAGQRSHIDHRHRAKLCLCIGQCIGEDETARTIVSTLNETGELIDPLAPTAPSPATPRGR